jgi:hypothetical protein
MDLIIKQPVTIQVNGIEVVALKKLSLVAHALAKKMGASSAAAAEATILGQVLDNLIRDIELAAVEAEHEKAKG